MTKYFEDIEVGESYSYGNETITEDDIIRFAEQYDPQPIHTDPEAAKDSMFDELIASGWHTGALCMRLWAEATTEKEWAQGIGKGIEELKWIRPVHAGDTFRIEFEVVDKYPSMDNTSYGNIHVKIDGYSQHDARVITFTSNGLIQRNQPADEW